MLCLISPSRSSSQTIIECLRQATTGELPPNCKSGQSFIQDPKISGDAEVKGQIKLKIKTIQGSPVVVIRSFQVKATRKTTTFKVRPGSPWIRELHF